MKSDGANAVILHINNIVIPDECGDTLWEAVLIETAVKAKF